MHLNFKSYSEIRHTFRKKWHISHEKFNLYNSEIINLYTFRIIDTISELTPVMIPVLDLITPLLILLMATEGYYDMRGRA
jgi:hypothetical protein